MSKNNIEQIIAWQKANAEYLKEYRRNYYKEYRVKNRVKCRAYTDKWQQKNRAKHNASANEYYYKNRDIILVKAKVKKYLKRMFDIFFLRIKIK